MKKILIISARGEKTFTEEQVEKLKKAGDVKFYKTLKALPESVFIKLAKNANILGITKRGIRDLNRRVLEKLTKLEGIAIYATGYEWIDTQYLKEKNIKLSYLPHYSTVTVAEHVMGMILTLSRKINLSMRKAIGELQKDISLKGFELKGKIHGIMGLGRIGRRVAQLSRCFGMEVYYYDKNKNTNYKFAKFLPFNELLSISQILTICISVERNSPCIIRENEIRKMRRGIYIINVSRKEVIDNEKVIEYINKGVIEGYALDDTLDKDLLKKLKYPHKLLLTAHTAWYSEEALKRGTQTWVENIIGLATGKYKNLVKL